MYVAVATNDQCLINQINGDNSLLTIAALLEGKYLILVGGTLIVTCREIKLALQTRRENNVCVSWLGRA